MKLKRITKRILSVLIAFGLIIGSILGAAPGVVKAAGTERLLNEESEFKITSIINNKTKENLNEKGVIKDLYYGDTIMVEMSWAFDDDYEFSTDDVFVYNLPTNVTFYGKDNSPVMKGQNQIGTYSIKGSKIIIQYSDAQFCSDKKRAGKLSFSGVIGSAADPNLPEENVDIHFPNDVDITLHMVPRPVEAGLKISKSFVDPNKRPSDDIYVCNISIEAIKNHTNVKFVDYMYPGMGLISDVEFFTDPDRKVPLDSSRYSNLSAPMNGRDISCDFDHLDDGEIIYIRYKVKVDPAMYEWKTANKYIEDNNYGNEYPNQYEGRIPNVAKVKSDQVPDFMNDWADINTLRASFNKWSTPELNKPGSLCWMIVLYGLDENYTNGYVRDILPENTEIEIDTISVSEVYNNYTEIPNAVNITTETEDGQKLAYINFNKNLIDYLHANNNRSGGIVRILYYTKIVSQEKDKDEYYNKAEIYFNGTKQMTTSSSMSYTKPEMIDKFGDYAEDTAPFINYSVKVNPAALDLSPDTDELTLEDTLSPSYDLILSSVKINGEPAENVDYDPDTRKMTLKLEDKKAYLITYDAYVNLAPNSELIPENSWNKADLYAGSSVLKGIEFKFTSDVYTSAASSSSENYVRIRVIKYDGDAGISHTLPGAEFKLTQFDLNNGMLENPSVITKTTGSNGDLNFNDLPREKVYMVQEVDAPNGYKVSDELHFVFFRNMGGANPPSTISYNGKDYPLVVIGADKLSTDIYVADERMTADLEVKKSVSDQDGKDINSTAEFEVTIKDSNGNYIDDKGGFTADKDTASYKTVTAAASCKFENLPVGETFTVEEKTPAADSVTGYSYSGNNAARVGTVTIGETVNTVTIVNTYTLQTGTLIIKKEFENAPSDIDKSKITFEVTDSADYKETVKYSEFESDGTYKIENLPVGEYTVTEKIEESELSKEEGGYKYTFDTEKSTTDLKVVDEVTDGGETEFSITNAYTKEEIPKEPETPETPETPEKPEKPVATPTDPATPTEPTQPETPETPETPEIPEEPKEPEVPETPGNTEKSEVPETPESAKTPENPTNQDVTKEPETPKAETVTDTTVITDTEKTDNDKKSTTVTDSTKKTADTDNTKKTTDTNVKTGDSGRIMLTVMGILALISMAYIGLWMFLRRKKNK